MAARLEALTRAVPPEVRPFDGAEAQRIAAAWRLLSDLYNLSAGVAGYRSASK